MTSKAKRPKSVRQGEIEDLDPNHCILDPETLGLPQEEGYQVKHKKVQGFIFRFNFWNPGQI